LLRAKAFTLDDGPCETETCYVAVVGHEIVVVKQGTTHIITNYLIFTFILIIATFVNVSMSAWLYPHCHISFTFILQNCIDTNQNRW
jgi:hypothetical protein